MHHGQGRNKHGIAAPTRAGRGSAGRPSGRRNPSYNPPGATPVRAPTGEETMASRSFQRSIRFTNNEWDAVIRAAEKAGLTPGAFVRRAAARAAADDLYLYGGGLTPELAEVIKRTFRGMHFLAWLRHGELSTEGREDDLEDAVEAARSELAELLGETDSDTED